MLNNTLVWEQNYKWSKNYNRRVETYYRDKARSIINGGYEYLFSLNQIEILKEHLPAVKLDVINEDGIFLVRLA